MGWYFSLMKPSHLILDDEQDLALDICQIIVNGLTLGGQLCVWDS